MILKRRGRLSEVVAVIGLILSFIAGVAGPSDAYPRPGTVIRVDISTGGKPSERQGPLYSDITPDGRYVAFDSTADDLFPGDTNQSIRTKREGSDVFVRDLRTDTTELISRTSTGIPSLGASQAPSISANGRYVAFESDAPNLVPGDTNGASDVFVFDRTRGAVERISITPVGAEYQEVFSPSWAASISDSGRYVSFTSWANLTNDDIKDPGIFVRDRKTGKVVRASVNLTGDSSSPCPPQLPNGIWADVCYALFPFQTPISSISPNGRFVAFQSPASDIVNGDSNNTWDVFVRDLEKDETERVSLASDGTEARGVTLSAPGDWSGKAWDGSQLQGFVADNPGSGTFSADSRFVVFVSNAPNLVPNDRNWLPATPKAGQDIFVHDRKTGRTERVSVQSDGRELSSWRSGSPDRPSISGDGRYISFNCFGCDSLFNASESFEGGYSNVYDRVTGAVEKTPRPSHMASVGSVTMPLSMSGRYLVAGYYDNSGSPDWDGGLFRVDRGSDLGASLLGGRASAGQERVHDRICITFEICILPGGAAITKDGLGDVSSVLTHQGANLYGASLAYRPQYGDLFARVQLQDMPSVGGALPIGGTGILYGLDFAFAETKYEIRVQRVAGPDFVHSGGASFGLFRQDMVTGFWSKVASLSGGYGTTGAEVVFSLPLDTIGLKDGGALSRVKAFSALGSYETGPAKIIDTVQIK